MLNIRSISIIVVVITNLESRETRNQFQIFSDGQLGITIN